jgi:hypothetical protein
MIKNKIIVWGFLCTAVSFIALHKTIMKKKSVNSAPVKLNQNQLSVTEPETLLDDISFNTRDQLLQKAALLESDVLSIGKEQLKRELVQLESDALWVVLKSGVNQKLATVFEANRFIVHFKDNVTSEEIEKILSSVEAKVINKFGSDEFMLIEAPIAELSELDRIHDNIKSFSNVERVSLHQVMFLN